MLRYFRKRALSGKPTPCRFFGVHALPTCLHRPTFSRAVHDSDLVSVILHAALDPLRVPTLLTLQSLGRWRSLSVPALHKM
jgi:hypothetical protein